MSPFSNESVVVLPISEFLTKPAEDIKGGISHVDRQYAIVNGTF
jgi:hypothetical protein